MAIGSDPNTPVRHAARRNSEYQFQCICRIWYPEAEPVARSQSAERATHNEPVLLSGTFIRMLLLPRRNSRSATVRVIRFKDGAFKISTLLSSSALSSVKDTRSKSALRFSI